VRGAVEAGDIAADRLESYHVLLRELEGAPRDWE
jgi:putative ribosome biogenesis GTPase RsgA